MVRHLFRPLSTDVRDADLRYLSAQKLQEFVLDPERAGFGLGAGLLGVSATASRNAKKLSQRELLESAAALLDRQGRLSYEIPARQGDYTLLRMFGLAGTMWPWAGRDPQLERVAWWVGRSDKYRVLAYGDRCHVLQDDRYRSASEEKATWWPSIPGAYRKLQLAFSEAADFAGDPQLNATEDVKNRPVSDLFNAFDDNTQRGPVIHDRGVYEVLMRVDGIEPESGGRVPIIYGSPLWVARVPGLVPGTYLVPSDCPQGRSLLGTWDGTWSDLRWVDYGDPRMRLRSAPDPETPNAAELEPPEPGHLRSLGIRDAPPTTSPRAVKSAAPAETVAPLPGTALRGVLNWVLRRNA